MSDLKSAQTDLMSLADYETQLYGKVQFLLDAVLGFITTKQNDIFQVLTVVSVAGIPPTLIASIYGMNFKNMPELNWMWGYPNIGPHCTQHHRAAAVVQVARLVLATRGDSGCERNDRAARCLPYQWQ